MARSTKDRSKFEPFITGRTGKAANLNGSPRCQSFNSRGDQCGNAAVRGTNTCAQTHSGGKGGAPIVTGEHSKYIPKLDKAVEEYLADPELTGLRKEIATISYRQDEVLDAIRLIEINKTKVNVKQFWDQYDELSVKKTALTIAENKRQAQLASNMNARQANILRAVLIAVLTDVVRDESVPRSQIPKIVGLKLIQKMS